MTTIDPKRDLEITRIIKAPRSALWAAWTRPEQFAKWWIPAPALCKIEKMDVRPGGALVTLMSEDGGPFGPHMDACYLDVIEGERIVFTTALTGGWRPAEHPFMTGVITFEDHPEGTAYRAMAMHKNAEQSDMHRDLGFYDGWGAVTAQLAALVEN